VDCYRLKHDVDQHCSILPKLVTIYYKSGKLLWIVVYILYSLLQYLLYILPHPRKLLGLLCILSLVSIDTITLQPLTTVACRYLLSISGKLLWIVVYTVSRYC
jgi:hypothetical protein